MIRDRKNIDRLYQEKLKDLEITPNEQLWENIQSKLPVKKRRIIPLWLKLSGVAAGLLLMFTIGNSIFSNEELPIGGGENSVVETEKNEDDKVNSTDNNSSTKENEIIEDLNSVNNNENEEFVDQSKKEAANEAELINEKNESLKAEEISKPVNNDRNSLVADNLNTHEEVEEIRNADSKKENQLVRKESSQLTNPQKESIDLTKKVAEATDIQNEIESLEKADDLTDDGKESITDAIAAAENPEKEPEEEEKEYKKWRVATNLAPVYFNTMGSGSSIHGQFDNNSKTSNRNMSYGVTASYFINERLSVRAGLNSVKLGYSTNDILVYNNIQVSTDVMAMRNIDFNKAAQDLSFISAGSFHFGQVPGVLSNHLNASIDQELGFLEVPLELEYKLIDKKFGFHIIGGFSALFLESNDIYSVVDGQSTLIGEATNINKTSYSANLGLGLNYKMSQKFNLNLEPVFKYQINTFTNTSGDFRPYFIGFYTGLSYKF